jgi:hypothetical protein
MYESANVLYVFMNLQDWRTLASGKKQRTNQSAPEWMALN